MISQKVLDMSATKDKSATLQMMRLSAFYILSPGSIRFLPLSPGQTDRQVVASGRKLNFGRDFRWVAKRTRKFPRKYTQVAKKHFKADYPLYWVSFSVAPEEG